VEEVWSSVHNSGRKPTAGAHAERNGDEHRTLASRSLCLQLTTGLERMPAWPAEADLSKTGCFISLELRNNWRSGFGGTPYAAVLAELQSNNNATRGRLSQTDCGRSVRVFLLRPCVLGSGRAGGGMSHFTPVSRITPAFGLSVTRCYALYKSTFYLLTYLLTVFTLYNRLHNRLCQHNRLYNRLGELCK